jgi:hypothetical protein
VEAMILSLSPYVLFLIACTTYFTVVLSSSGLVASFLHVLLFGLDVLEFGL